MLTGFPMPLSGLKVLDLTNVIYGPYATQILGDFGADVIKIEPPVGDVTRAIGPKRNPDMSALFLGSNRNKRSIVLDLKEETSRAALWALIEGADVFVHNMRPQKIDSLGFGAQAVFKRKPDIIYSALLGYHTDGPYSGMPAYDDVIQGQSGLAGTFTARDGEPVLAPTILADKTAGLQAANGMMAAVIRRMASGKGVMVETSMFEGMVGYVMLEHQQGTMFNPPISGPGYARALSRDRRPHRTEDGFICMLAYSDLHWQKFWTLTNQPDKAVDPKFANVSLRADNIDELYGLVAKALANKPTATWLKLLQDADIPAGPVNRLEDVLDDKHLKEIDFFRPFEHPTEGPIEVPDTPYRLDGDRLPIARHQPSLGEHTREVLSEAGLSPHEIDAVTKERSGT